MAFHQFTSDRPGWETVEDTTAFANPYLEVHQVKVTSPTRSKPFSWTVCHRKGAVVVAPQTAEGEFVLVRQERVPIRATIWEFPAGQIDDATDTRRTAIRATGLRELREESGYELAPGGEVDLARPFFSELRDSPMSTAICCSRGLSPERGRASMRTRRSPKPASRWGSCAR